MAGLADLFDPYSLRARIYPALLTAAPVAASVAVVAPHSQAHALWPLALAIGVTYFLAGWVRDRGKRLEAQLAIRWDGMPTTRMLRWRGNDPTPAFRRRRERLQATTGISLPDLTSETEASDSRYEMATRALIARTRGDQAEFTLIRAENTQFGFRRNLLAMKPIGLLLSLGSFAFDLVWGLVATPGPAALLAAAHLLVLLAWLCIVSPEWVRRQGETYAERLFEALEHPSMSVTN